MDLQLGPGIDGIAATRRLKEILPELPVLVLTTYDAEADILAAVEAGASGYMLKDAPPEQIHQAVQDAAAGRTALAPQVAARLMDRVRSPAPSLSGREVELLELLATGAPNREMARQLFISEVTVKTHLVHIYQSFGVDNRVSAVAEARSRCIRGARDPGADQLVCRPRAASRRSAAPTWRLSTRPEVVSSGSVNSLMLGGAVQVPSGDRVGARDAQQTACSGL